MLDLNTLKAYARLDFVVFIIIVHRPRPLFSHVCTFVEGFNVISVDHSSQW